MIDLDDLAKEAKLSHRHFDTKNLRCLRCLKKMRPYHLPRWATDKNDDAPVFDAYCTDCLNRAVLAKRTAPPSPIKIKLVCNWCHTSDPLFGMAWCEPCALKWQRIRLDDGEDPAVVEGTIAMIKRAAALSGTNGRTPRRSPRH